MSWVYGITIQQLSPDEQPAPDSEVQEVLPPPEVVKEPSSSKPGPKERERELEAKRKKMNLIKRFSLPGINLDTKSKLDAEIATYKGEPVNLDNLESDLFSYYWKERATAALPILSKNCRFLPLFYLRRAAQVNFSPRQQSHEL